MSVLFTLMDELVEGMLSIGPRFTPHNGSSGVVHPSPTAIHTLPIGLHVTLQKTNISPWLKLLVTLGLRFGVETVQPL